MIGSNVTAVQALFKGIFNIGDDDLKADGSAFDVLLENGQELPLGDLTIRVLHTPGHTPACVTYVIGDACFTGDTIFMPDFGSARCDFPKGSAEDLFQSVTSTIFALPDSTRVFVGHDYAPGGRDIAWETTIGEEKASNKHLKAGVTKESFVTMRVERDGTLNAPKLLLPALQVNLRNGRLPAAEANGTSFLKIPLNVI
jgi:glyoxylase-like metal-dependent hydrolase (beta-lactamase superfamily II)